MIEVWLGQAGSGKTTSVCMAAMDAQEQHPEGGPIFVITPDQATFVVEKRLLEASREGVLTRVQVYHFRRLALRMLSDHQQLPLGMISQAGKYAIFSACFQEALPKLDVLARTEQDSRYLDRLLKLIEEFQENGTLHDFEKWLQSAALSSRVQAKMQDLLILWKTYESAIADRFLDPYHLMPTFATYLSLHAKEVAKWTVYIDGFLGFTGQEWKVIESLAKTACKMVVTIGMPPDWADKSESELLELVEFSPFAQAVDVLNKLRKLSQDQGVPLQTGASPNYRQGARFESPSLHYLETTIFSPSSTFVTLAKEGSLPGLRMASAPHMEEEVRGMIQDLIRQKRRRGFRFRDFSLIVTDWEAYRPVLVRELQRAGIPFSIDERTSIASHPFPRLILSLIGFAAMQADEAAEMIKSDLFLLDRDAADRLENYLYENGMTLGDWVKEESVPADAEWLAIKEKLVSALRPFFPQEKNHQRSVESWLIDLWALLEQIQITDKLMQEKSSQMVTLTLQILDDLSLTMGDRNVTAKMLYEQLYHAFHSATTGSIPARVNEVLVTEVSRVRAFETEVVYLLGCQEGTFPKRVNPDELLGDREREELNEQGQFIAADSDIRQQFERYRVYMALTRAKKQLILSYTLQDDAGKSRLPAILLRKWQRDFSGLTVESWESRHLLLDEESLLSGNRKEAAENLGQVLSATPKIEDIPVVFKAVYRMFASGVWPKSLALPYWLGMGHTAKSDTLPREVAGLLYGEKLSGNVSRLERFAACPFAHFVDYGLKAKERKQVAWDARNQGNFLHQVLHEVQMELSENEIIWRSLTDEQVDEVTSAIFAKEVSRFEGGRLIRGGRNQLLAIQLKRTILRAMRTLTEHMRRSDFFPWKLEEKFSYEDPHGGFLLKGRMDRIDLAKEDSQFWFRIIDFKSSTRSVDFAKMYYGLSLQLLLYAGVSEDESPALFGKKARFAGMFYFPVIDPIRQKKQFTSPEQALETLRKDTKMKGIIIGEHQVVDMLDRRIAEGKTDLFNKMLNKDGEWAESSPAISENAWKALKQLGYDHARSLSAAASEGDTAIRPYKLQDETPCAFCELQSVCAFEPQFHGAWYRRLRPLKKQDVLLALEEGEWQ